MLLTLRTLIKLTRPMECAIGLIAGGGVRYKCHVTDTVFRYGTLNTFVIQDGHKMMVNHSTLAVCGDCRFTGRQSDSVLKLAAC